MNTKQINPTTKFLSFTDKEIASIEAQREELDRSLAALRSAREAVASQILAEAASQPRHRDKGGSRVDLLKAILTETKKPLSVDDILKELADRGHHTTRTNVSSTLQYLKSKNLAHQPEPRKWGNVTQLPVAA